MPNPYSAHPTLWLSPKAAAARIGVNVRTIKRWIAASILPATRLPSPKGLGHLRIRLSDLECLMASGTLS
jgi:excisionase family DNA binding protein